MGREMDRIKVLIISISIILITTALLTYTLNYGNANEADSTPPPNIILIVIDTLRADHLGCYGYEKNTSPNIDRFAGESTFYRNAYAQAPYTLPSHASLFTSLYPSQHWAVQTLAEEHITMAEILKEQGYSTYAITGGGLVSERFGLLQGFDSIEYNKDRGFISLDKEIHAKILDTLTLIKNVKQPFFLFLHSYQVHEPYFHPEEYDIFFEGEYNGKITGSFLKDMKEQAKDDIEGLENLKTLLPLRYFEIPDEDRLRVISLYDQGILYADSELQIMFDALKEAGLYDEALIVLTSDHGDEFFEHGGWQHGHTLYNEMIKIPLIVKYPEFLGQKPAEYDFTARLIDVLPTTLDVIKAKVDYHFEGQSLISGKRKEMGSAAMMIDPEGEIFKISEVGLNQKYKYINTNDKTIPIDKRGHFIRPKDLEELYYLKEDRQENSNIIKDNLKTKKKLVKVADKHRALSEGYSKYADLLKEPEELKLDEATIEQLKTLGCIH
jgi:arylsulfatase A-like enzyme